MEQQNGATDSAAPTPLDTDDTTRCPKQTIAPDDTFCSIPYGAYMNLCYERAGGWWSKEEVTEGKSDCHGAKSIHQAGDAEQLPDSGCTYDRIVDYGALPQIVAPCKHVTHQTIFLGPTKEANHCKYENEQIIEVTLEKKDTPKAGRVITTSHGVSTSCDWQEVVFK